MQHVYIPNTGNRGLHDGQINPKITHLTRLLHSLNNHGELVRDCRDYLIVKCCSGLCLTWKAPLILPESDTKQQGLMRSVGTGTSPKNWLCDTSTVHYRFADSKLQNIKYVFLKKKTF